MSLWKTGAEAYITFDNYSYLRQQLRNDYPTYSIDRYLNAAGDEKYVLQNVRN